MERIKERANPIIPKTDNLLGIKTNIELTTKPIIHENVCI